MTIEPKLSGKKDSTTVYGDALFRYSTANTERTGHFKVGIGSEKLSSVFAYTVSAFNDLESGSVYNSNYPDFGKRTWYQTRIGNRDTMLHNSNAQLQRSSGYNQQNFMSKTGYKPTKNTDLGLNLHYSTTSDIPRYDRLTQENDSMPKYAEWYYGPQSWFMGNITANFDFGNDAWDRSKIIVAYQNFKESRNDRKFQNNNLRSRTEEVNMYSVNIDFDKFIGSKHTLYYGFEGVLNQVYSEGHSENIITGARTKAATRYPDGGSYWASAAAYITYKLKINKKLTFNTGLRYTYMEMESNFNDTSFYDLPYDKIHLSTSALNGSFLGLTYAFKPQMENRFKYS